MRRACFQEDGKRGCARIAPAARIRPELKHALLGFSAKFIVFWCFFFGPRIALSMDGVNEWIR
jgi:hypothetical protein